MKAKILKLSKTEFHVYDVVLHATLFIAPVLIVWLLTQNASRLRLYLPHLQTHSEIVARQRLLEEILSQTPPSEIELDNMFSAYANYYRIDKNLLRSIGYCESRFNPAAINGRHAGMYQFNPITWQVTRIRMGYDPDPNLRFDAEESIKTAAFKISNSGSGAWAVCSAKYYSR